MTMYLLMNLKVFAIVSAMVLTVGMLAATNFVQPVMAKDNPTKDNPTKWDNPTLVPEMRQIPLQQAYQELVLIYVLRQSATSKR